MIWVIGQYADRIDNSDVLLEDFLYTFADEPVEVQLALLTATVKLFIQRPTKGQDLVPKVLKWATEETDNPDLRDRGYMYWRLLSTDPATAKHVVMGEKPPITAETEKLDPVTLEEMCLNVGTLATVYLKPVQQVFRNARPKRLTESPALVREKITDHVQLPPLMANMAINASSSSSLTAVTPSAAQHQQQQQQHLAAQMDDYFAGVGSGIGDVSGVTAAALQSSNPFAVGSPMEGGPGGQYSKHSLNPSPHHPPAVVFAMLSDLGFLL